MAEAAESHDAQHDNHQVSSCAVQRFTARVFAEGEAGVHRDDPAHVQKHARSIFRWRPSERFMAPPIRIKEPTAMATDPVISDT